MVSEETSAQGPHTNVNHRRPSAASSKRPETEEHRPSEKPFQQRATANAKGPTSPSTPAQTQEQNNALYHYARALLRSEHQRKHEKLTYDQQLEIDNLMFLLSRDSKEMCEVVLGAVDGETVGQEDDVRKLEGVSGEDGGGGEVVCPAGVAARASFFLVVLVLVALLLKQFDLAEAEAEE